MNYLNLVNAVLRRLREDDVTSVTDNNYSKLIGSYVNDSKQEVENAYSWNALTSTIVATTQPNIINYVLTGSGHRFEVVDVWNNSEKVFLENTPSSLMTQWLLTTSPQKGSPGYYAFNGQSAAGDVQVDLYPIPDAAYNIYFNVVTPQADLVNNTDDMLVPSQPVILGAYARALAERGEDAGIGSGDAYGQYLKVLADTIALESQRYVEESTWIPS
jgi:hypothetical protein